jgi:hypothetical protein
MKAMILSALAFVLLGVGAAVAQAQGAPSDQGLQAPPDSVAHADALNGQVNAHNDSIAAHNQAALDDYNAKLAAIAAQKQADADAYAAQLAARQAALDAQKQQYAAAIADWQARVAACKAGDRSKCAH